MKQIDREIIDEGDLRTVKMLSACGCGESEARCLCYLLTHESAMATDIESSMDMRQPEVSVGLTRLLGKGLVNIEKMPHKGKGRPRLKYTLPRKDVVHGKLKNNLQDVMRAANVHMNDLDELFLALK
jgi:predicted transcriptional regulator